MKSLVYKILLVFIMVTTSLLVLCISETWALSVDDFDFEKGYIEDAIADGVGDAAASHIDDKIPGFKNGYDAVNFMTGKTYDLSDSFFINRLNTVVSNKEFPNSEL